MLVLSRKIGETIRVGDDVEITVTRIGLNAVRIGIEAPDATRIVRGELVEDLPVNGSSQDGERMDCEGDGAPFYYDHDPLLVGGEFRRKQPGQRELPTPD